MRRILYILGVISLVIMSLPFPVQAITTNLTVDGEGDVTSGTYVGAPANFTNMNSDDDGATILDLSGTNYHFWSFSACPTAVISNVTFFWKNIKISGTNLHIYCRIGGVNYYAGGFTSYAAYTLQSYTWAVNPATTVAWTKSDVDSAQFGIYLPNALYETYITYCYLTIDYASAPPSVSTSAATLVAVTTATLNGEVTNTNGANVTSEGFVWDNVTHDPLASTNVTPGNGYASWWYQNGTYSAGAFTDPLTGLISGQTYYYRACANNTYGWNYGDEVTFTMIGVPTISTVAASYVSTVTAQLNANVVNSSGQPCDVRFGYGNTSQAATLAGFNAYDTRTAWVNDTYVTGNLPLASLTGLLVGTIYYFNVQIENDAGISYGVEQSFTTYTGLNPPTNFIAIPSATSTVLTWAKDPSSALTEIRWSASTYPNTTADGSLLYLGALSSTTHSNLTIGTTIYYSAWGASGGLFSTAKATTLGTTMAGTIPVVTVVPVSATSMWVAMPSELGLANLPIYSYFNWAFDAYSMPRATGWVLLFMGLTLIMGLVLYMKAPSNNLLLTGVFIGVMMGWGTLIGMPAHCLIPIWATLAYWIMFVTIATVANRY